MQKVVEKPLQQHYLKLTDEYNSQMKTIIDAAHSERVVFASVIEKIGLSPDNIPLVMDGTHLNWPIQQGSNTKTVSASMKNTVGTLINLIKQRI